jgi:hypothetical protein
LESREETWVRVTGLDENGTESELHADLLATGDRKEFTAHRFRVRLADPSLVRVWMNDQEVGNLSDERTPQEFTLPQGAASGGN